MSADNGLAIGKVGNKYCLAEYCASTDCSLWELHFDTLEEAVKAAQNYMSKEVVEYGIQFDI